LIDAVEVAFESIYVSGPETAELSQPGILFLANSELPSFRVQDELSQSFDFRFSNAATNQTGLFKGERVSPTR
jgi:hypothetical protein